MLLASIDPETGIINKTRFPFDFDTVPEGRAHRHRFCSCRPSPPAASLPVNRRTSALPPSRRFARSLLAIVLLAAVPVSGARGEEARTGHEGPQGRSSAIPDAGGEPAHAPDLPDFPGLPSVPPAVPAETESAELPADPAAGEDEAALTAAIRGAVATPGTYTFRKGETLSALVMRSGGYADVASLRGAILVRESEKARQGDTLRGLVEKVEAALDPARRDAGPHDRDRIERLLASLRDLRPAGRVPVRLAHPRLMKGTEGDLPLEQGDLLFIPAEPDTVRVAGAVPLPGLFPWSAKAGYRDYIRKAGGFAGEADRGNVVVFKADWTARRFHRKRVAWNRELRRWELTAFTRKDEAIEPGDTIVVPEAPGTAPWADEGGDIPETLLRIAELTGTVLWP
jgi:protein involved in polysaccharide export with SLBB domain